MIFEQMEQALHECLDALGLAPRAELLHVLMLPDFGPAGAIQSYSGIRRPPRSASC